MTDRANLIAATNALLGVAVAGIGLYPSDDSFAILALILVGATIAVIGGINSFREEPGYYPTVATLALGMLTIIISTNLPLGSSLTPITATLGAVISSLALYNGHTAACHRAVSLTLGRET